MGVVILCLSSSCIILLTRESRTQRSFILFVRVADKVLEILGR